CVVEEFWCRVLDPNDDTAPWAQISFWPFVLRLSQDLVKKEIFEKEVFHSLESSPLGILAYEILDPHSTRLNDAVLTDELRQFLKPLQKRAFILRHDCGLTQPEIAVHISRTERTVRNLLHVARGRLRQAVR